MAATRKTLSFSARSEFLVGTAMAALDGDARPRLLYRARDLNLNRPPRFVPAARAERTTPVEDMLDRFALPLGHSSPSISPSSRLITSGGLGVTSTFSRSKPRCFIAITMALSFSTLNSPPFSPILTALNAAL